MTISINTSDYIKYKDVEIDGVKLGLRMMNSAETLEMSSLQRKLGEKNADAPSVMSRLLELFYGLYSDSDKAREILSNLSIAALSDIYTRVMESE